MVFLPHTAQSAESANVCFRKWDGVLQDPETIMYQLGDAIKTTNSWVFLEESIETNCPSKEK